MAKRKETYKTEEGVVLTFRPVRPSWVAAMVSTVEDEFREKNEAVDVPQGRLITLKGTPQEGLELCDLNADNLANEDPVEEQRNRSLWAKHQDAVARMEAAKLEKQTKLLFMLGLEYDEEAEVCKELYAEWERDCRRAKFEIPEDEDERRFAFLWFRVLSPSDKGRLRLQLEAFNYGDAMTPEQRATFRDLIRSAMGRAVGEAVERAAEAIGPLVAEPEADGDEDGEGMGPVAEPMGQAAMAGQGGDDVPDRGGGGDEQLGSEAPAGEGD